MRKMQTMNTVKRIEIDPDGYLTSAAFVCFGEWTTHMQLLVAKQGDDFDANRIADQELRIAMRAPLLEYMNELRPDQQLEFRASLQYLLNRDEAIPYSDPDSRNPAWREKKGSLAQKIRDNCQDTFVPYDGYAMCQWMWEALFGEEDWHTDISNWVVVNH